MMSSLPVGKAAAQAWTSRQTDRRREGGDRGQVWPRWRSHRRGRHEPQGQAPGQEL